LAGVFKKWISKLMEIPDEEKVEKESQETQETSSDITSDESSAAAYEQTAEEPTEEPTEEPSEDTSEVALKSAAVTSEARHEQITSEAQTQTEAEAAPPAVKEAEPEIKPVIPETAEAEAALPTVEEAQPVPVSEPTPAPAAAPGFFERLKSGLSKTSKAITDRIDLLLNDYGKIDEELYEELEEILITADIGMETTISLIDNLKKALVERRISDASQVKSVLRDVMVDTLSAHSDNHLNIDQSPAILFVIGVNGAGKTTTIGKIAHKLNLEGKTVMLAAADTFRAAAIDQLKIWGERSGVPVIAHQEGSDPAAVVFDAIQAAKARKTDVLICDTAGRLHNKKNLMNELAKIFRVIERDYPEAQREVLLVLDATTGQNGLQQAKIFKETAQITGIALTKLDGTAKGGVVLSILHEVEIPVKLIGVGEGMNDLQPFDPEKFVNALLDLA
jgi:fused signal recognition particle receptor